MGVLENDFLGFGYAISMLLANAAWWIRIRQANLKIAEILV